MSANEMPASTALDLERISDAIDRMNGAFTYDPREVWMPSYTYLLGVQSDLRRARRPFAALGLILTLGMMVSLFLAIFVNGYFWLFVLLGLPIEIYTESLYERSVPAAQRLSDIEDACRPFRRLLDNEQQVRNA